MEEEELTDAAASEPVKTAFVVVLGDDGIAYATNAVRDLIVDDEGTPTLLEPEDRATPQQMLAAVKTVEADIERALTVRSTVENVVPNLLNAQMQAAQKLSEQQGNRQLAQQVMQGQGNNQGSQIHVPGQ